MKNFYYLALIFILMSCNSERQAELNWSHDLTTETFAQAKKEDKLVLLSLEANWCHWCHVMEDSTYANEEIKGFLNEHFILVKADQDANPELAARYRQYGWPATVVLNSEGKDLWKNAGYVSPQQFIEKLGSILKNPVAEKAKRKANFGTLTPTSFELKNQLESSLNKALDYQKGGFKSAQKSIDGETFEYVFFHANKAAYQQWIKASLKGAYQLSDPEWGGIYQYSTYGDWEHLHFEKLLHIQARYLNMFSWDYAYSSTVQSKETADRTIAYCDAFLRQKSGLYGNAQDADLIKGKKATNYFQLTDSQRRKLGVPAVDTNTYTFSNADWGSALLHYYATTSDEKVLEKALTIEKELAKRKDANGLFRHSYSPEKVYTLRDNMPVLNFYIEASKLFPDSTRYNKEVKKLTAAMMRSFEKENEGFVSFVGEIGLAPHPILEENIRLARLLNWAGHRFDNQDWTDASKGILQYLQIENQMNKLRVEPGILLFLEELTQDLARFESKEKGNDMLMAAFARAPFATVFSMEKSLVSDAKNTEKFKGFKEDVAFFCTAVFCSSPFKTTMDVHQFFERNRKQ